MNSSTLVRNGLCMAIAALAAHPLHAATVTVSTAADLLAAMQNAASGDTIRITPGEYDITGVADNNWYHLYSNNKALTLEGTDATSWRDQPSRETATVLKGGSSSRIMLGYYGNFTLKHITLKGANHTGDGAALSRNTGGVAVVTNCVFASNRCTMRGAAASCQDGVFQDCLFTGNTSEWGGGAAYFGEFHSCEFDSNTGARGGAVLDVNAYDCVFTNNTASMFGGTAYYSSSSHTMRDCTILASRATAQHGLGGAVYQGNGTISVEGCTFSGCIANGGYTADGYRAGGAICEGGGSMEISNSTFTNCTATTRGGAIFCKSGTASLSGCSFIGNVAQSGGALYDGARGAFVTNCTFSANNATSAGGAVGNCTNVVACSFANNTNAYFGAHCFGSIVRDSRFIGDGGVGNSRLVRCVLDGVHTTGDNLWNRAAMIAVANSTPDFPVQAVNCLFVNCKCFYLLQSWGLPMNLVNCTFADNELSADFAFGNQYEGGGGAAWSFANCIVSRNKRGTAAIGLEVIVATGVSLDLDIRNCLADSVDIPVASSSPVRTVSTSELNIGKARFVGVGHYSGAPAYTPTLSDSLVVNRGLVLDWTASDIDLAGNSRICGGGVDLGCYESCYAEHATVLSIR